MKTEKATAPCEGRPKERNRRPITERGLKRRETILAVAAKEFLEKGYDGSSIKDIIRAAGGSSDSVYRMFGSKERLFKEVIDNLINENYRDFFKDENYSKTIDEELFNFGLSYVNTVTADHALRFYRLMISSGGSLPEVSQSFWETGISAVSRRLETYLRREHARGVIDVPDPALAAVQFMELAKGGIHIRQLCTGERPPEQEVRRRVRAAVDLFVKAVACDKNADGARPAED